MKNTINAEKAEYRAKILAHAYSIWEACGGDEDQMEQLVHEAADADTFWFEECIKVLRYSERLVACAKIAELVSSGKYDFATIVEAAAYLQVRGDIEEILSVKRLKKAMDIS